MTSTRPQNRCDQIHQAVKLSGSCKQIALPSKTGATLPLVSHLASSFKHEHFFTLVCTQPLSKHTASCKAQWGEGQVFQWLLGRRGLAQQLLLHCKPWPGCVSLSLTGASAHDDGIVFFLS